MPTITISDDVYQLLEQQAKMTQRTPEDILNEVVRRELSPYPGAIAPSASEMPASHHATEVAIAQHNYTIFRQQLPELLKEHAGEFVALRHGQIVGFGRDKKALWHQTRGQYGPGGILVMEVTETPRVVHISFSRVSRAH
jgi:hypothetical protein